MLISFSVFFLFTIFGIPDIERRKKRGGGGGGGGGGEGFSSASHKDLCPKVDGSLCFNCFNFNVYIFLWLAYLKINS